MRIAVTGATGYIGGRLVPRLVAEGHDVICLARNPAKLAGRSWTDQVEAITADVLQPETLVDALRGSNVAIYLIHSMGSSESFRASPRRFSSRLRNDSMLASSISVWESATKMTPSAPLRTSLRVAL